MLASAAAALRPGAGKGGDRASQECRRCGVARFERVARLSLAFQRGSRRGLEGGAGIVAATAKENRRSRSS